MSAGEFDPQTWPVSEVLVLPESEGVLAAVYLGIIGGPKPFVRIAFKDGRPALDSMIDWRWSVHGDAVPVFESPR